MIKEIKGAISDCLSLYYRIFKPAFIFNGRKYRYYCHKYNKTWRNERAIELPIVMKAILGEWSKMDRTAKILEVGNTLSNYMLLNHDIVDKYDYSENIINEDIVDYAPKKKYDLIVCISTIEHVGFDPPEELDAFKTLKAVENMKALLAKGGRIIITFPTMYNPHLDYLVETGRMRFSEMHCFKRMHFLNIWKKAEWDEIKNIVHKTGLIRELIPRKGLVIGIIAW